MSFFQSRILSRVPYYMSLVSLLLAMTVSQIFFGFDDL